VDALSLERREEAASFLEMSFHVFGKQVESDGHDADALANFVRSGLKLGRIAAVDQPRAAVAIYDRVLSRVRPSARDSALRKNYRIRLLAESSIAMRKLGRPGEARARLEAAIGELREARQWPPRTLTPTSTTEPVVRAHAESKAAEGEIAEAAAIYENAILVMRPQVKSHEDLEHAYGFSLKLQTAAEWLDRGNPGAAAQLRSENLDLWRHWEKKAPDSGFVRTQLRAAQDLAERQRFPKK
jgi:hypothetical protein